MKLKSLRIFVFSSILLLISCQKEDLLDEHNSTEIENNFVVNQITFKKVTEDTKALEKLNEVFQKDISLAGRGFYYQDYGVFIDTINIMMIEHEGIRSITFQIINESREDLVQNLVLNSTNLKDYTAYITTYLLSPEEQIRLKNGEQLRDKLPYAINDTRQQRGGVLGDGADCIDVYTYTQYFCYDKGGRLIKANGDNDSKCRGMSWSEEVKVYKIAADCMSSGGGLHGPDMPTNPGPPLTPPGPGGSGGGIPGTGTNPGSSPNNPPIKPEDQVHDPGNGSIITTPLLVRNTKKPCEQLKNMTTIPGYEHDINLLKQRAQGTKEYAWAYKYSSTTGSFLSGTIVGDSQTNPNQVDLSAFMGGDYVGAAHNHLNPNTTDGIAMFSPGDIRWLFQCARKHNTNGQPKDYSLYFLLLVVEGRNYAIKIKDGNKFQLNFNAMFPKIEKKIKDAYDKSTQYADAFTLQKDLLKVLNKHDIGIGLYEEIETNGNKVWNELTLDPNNPNANPVKKPCN